MGTGTLGRLPMSPTTAAQCSLWLCRIGESSPSELATYREWAEKRMGHMISCLQDSERARREELQRVQQAASQLIKVLHVPASHISGRSRSL